jgi:DNA uptake protein ComE-like DNA-binding protein
MSNNTLYKYKKTQALVRLVNYFDEGEWLMVEDEEGNVFTAHKTQVEEDPKANTAVKRVAVKDRAANDEPRKFPPEKKLNINKASAQMIADTIRGIGIRTAREIKDAQMSLPGEKFSDIEQLRKIPKVDWDLVFKDELIRL